MTRSNTKELELHTTSCFVAYDADSGDILYVHEVISEGRSYDDKKPSVCTEDICQMASRDFEKRSIKAIELPQGVELRQEASYWVDPCSREIKELSMKETTFKDFLREAE